MKIIEVKNYQEMSQTAAKYIINKVRNSRILTLGLATGSHTNRSLSAISSGSPTKSHIICSHY